MTTSYSEIKHYWNLNLYPSGTTSGPVYGGITTRGTEFEGNSEKETSEYKGHSGTDSMLLQEDITSATGEPNWTHGLVFGEGLEDYCKLLLGKDTSTTLTTYVDGKDASNNDITKKVNKWIFQKDLINNTSLPRCTIINGYSGAGAARNDARVYDNALMSELALNIGNDGATVEVSFASDAAVINQPNPTKNFPDALHKVGLRNVKYYLAPYGTNLYEKWSNGDDLSDYQYDCLLSYENTWSTNPSEDECIGTDFGKANHDEGGFSSEATVQVKWNPKSNKLVSEYWTGSSDGVYASDEVIFKEALLVMEGALLTSVTESGTTTNYREHCVFYEPKVQVTNCSTPESGEDTKTVDIEYKLVENGYTSPLIVEIVSNLEALHYGTPSTYITSADDTTTSVPGSVRSAT